MFISGFFAAYLIYTSHLIYEKKIKNVIMDDEVMGVTIFYTDIFSVVKHLF